MLSKEAQEKLLKLAKATPEEIADLLGDEEKDYTPSSLRVYTDDEFTTVEANIKKDAIKEGIKTGKDIAFKEVKKIAGLPDDAPKDPTAIIEAYKEAILKDANIPANEAKARLEQEKQELQKQIQEWQNKAAEKEKEAANIAREKEWFSKFPANRNEMSDDDRMLLLKNKLQIVEEDGTIAYMYKGQRLQDNMKNDLPIDKVMEHVFNSEGWLKSEGEQRKGRGEGSGKNNNGLKPLKASEAAEQWKAQGKGEAMGAEYQAYLGGLVKENPQFDLNG